MTDVLSDLAVDGTVSANEVTAGTHKLSNKLDSATASTTYATKTELSAKADSSALSAYQQTSQKGAANGYASLDNAGDVPIAQIPTGVTSGKVPRIAGTIADGQLLRYSASAGGFVAGEIGSVYRPCGSVATYADLPASPSVGDVYNVIAAYGDHPAGMNYAWTADGEWDAIGGAVDLSAYALKTEVAVKQDALTAGTGISISGTTIGHSNSITARTSNLGSATSVPIIRYDAQGHITYSSSATIYPPTSVGVSGQYWRSDGSGQGVWQSLSTSPTSGNTTAITSGAVYTALAAKQNTIVAGTGLAIADDGVTVGHSNAIAAKTTNLGSATSVPIIRYDSEGHITYGGSATIYPPTTAGTANQYWRSDGSGQGVWTTPATSPTSGSNTLISSGAVYTALAAKQATITGAATTITTSNLTASRALVSNGNGKVAVSAVTSTELGYLDGVTSAIQTQLNGKVPTTRTVNGKALSANVTIGISDINGLQDSLDAKADVTALNDVLHTVSSIYTYYSSVNTWVANDADVPVFVVGQLHGQNGQLLMRDTNGASHVIAQQWDTNNGGDGYGTVSGWIPAGYSWKVSPGTNSGNPTNAARLATVFTV